MSRRKQSNPKPLKRRSDDELEELCRVHRLPSDILQLKDSESGDGEVGVFTTYPLARGSCIFGPFKASPLHESTDRVTNHTVLQFPTEDGKVTVTIESESGSWLKLIRSTVDGDHSNVSICLQDSSVVWCEITRDISEEMELVAVLNHESENPHHPLHTLHPQQREGYHPADPTPTCSSPVGEADTPPALTSSPGRSTPADGPHNPDTPAPTTSPNPTSTMVVKNLLHPSAPSGGLARPEPDRSPDQRKTSPESSPPHPARFPLIYGCVHCGVKFSNPGTLGAHIEFYCSKKPAPINPTLPGSDSRSGDGLDSDQGSMKSEDLYHKRPRSTGMDQTAMSSHSRQPRPPSPGSSGGGRRSDGDLGSTSKDKRSRKDDDSSPDTPAPKVPRTGQLFQCPLCSYSADKKISLNRHLRIHNNHDDSNGRSQTTSPEGSEQAMYLAENFCRECNIQFSSRKTYFGHKEYYCATRRKSLSCSGSQEDSSSPQSVPVGEGMPLPGADPGIHGPFLPQHAAAYAVQSLLSSPTCSQAVTNMFGQQAAVVVATPMMAPSGVGSITAPTVILQPLIAMPPNMSPRRQSQILNQSLQSLQGSSAAAAAAAATSAPSPPKPDKDELPLDLSVRRESPKVKPVVEHDDHHKDPAVCSTKDRPKQSRDTFEPQDLTIKREYRGESTPSSERSPRIPSPSHSDHSLRRRSTPEHPPEGVPGLPPQAADLMVAQAQAQVINMMNHQAAAAAMMLAQPHISKCMECNIVFYKHENFLIHKEHYCAGRRISKRERLMSKEHSPSGTPVSQASESHITNGTSRVPSTDSSPPPAKSTSAGPTTQTSLPLLPPSASGMHITEIPPMDQAFLQFYCIPCKIKFSSMDTLRAHQQFYCPFNSESQPESHRDQQVSPITATEPDGPPASHPDSGSGSETLDSDGAIHTCPNCGNSYPSTRLLKLHFCKAAAAHVPLLRCPYCDFITQSDNRLVEHIKAHAPTKAYRCTICGYRGNTVRGMRMHGKTHVDEGETFTDENMVEYEEPPLIPKRHRTTTVETSPLDMEAELIRLKNEPYKRRRSRKLYEKPENFPLRRQAPHVCPTCNEMFSDTSKLRHHIRVHVEEATFACRSCDLITTNKASLVRHVKRVHEANVQNTSRDSSTDDLDTTSRNTDSVESEVALKQELPESPPETLRNHSQRSPHGDPSSVNSEKPYPEIKAETNGHLESGPVVHVKREKSDNDINQNRCPSARSAPSDGYLTPSPTQNENEAVRSRGQSSPGRGKRTPSSPGIHGSTPLRPTTPLSPVNGKPDLSPQELLLQRKGDKSGTNYCKQCDITFVYMSSFIAHKKYYCSSHIGEKESTQTEV